MPRALPLGMNGRHPGKVDSDGVNHVFSQPPCLPFRWTFMVDGKTMADKYKDDAQVIEESERLKSWYVGMTSQSPKMVKLFSDGAIYFTVDASPRSPISMVTRASG